MPTQHYHGSCQCGRIAYEVDVDLDHTITCNCSRCRRWGAVLAFAPRAQFTLHAGEGEMTEFLFNMNRIHHLFCKTCGIECFAYATMPDGTEMVAINANCLDGVDARSLPAEAVDGASR